MKSIILCRLFLGLLFLFSILAGTGETMATELAPNLYKTKLPNGLNILVKETPGSKVATVQLWVKAGSVYEDAGEGGITHLIEHMIFKGTPTRGPGALAGAIEEVGGRVNAYTYYEYTVYHATLSARHWSMAADVLTDALLNSSFDAQELEREKKVVLEEIGMREDRPTIKLFQELMAKSYNTHPYRLPIIGTRKSVSSFTRENILTYVKKHYLPENFTVVVVGDVRQKEVVAKFTKLMGGLKPGPGKTPELLQEKSGKAPVFFRLPEDINQSHLAISFPITRFKHPDTAVFDVISNILGRGEASRLYHQVRDIKGLVYSVDSSAFTPLDPGLFELSATMESGKTAQAMEAILEELFKLKYLAVEADELARAKRNLESEFVFALERVEGQARVLGSFEFLTGDPRETEYLEKVRSVSSEDILRVANEYFIGEHMTAGVVTPKNQKVKITDDEIAQILTRAENMARHGAPTSLVPGSYLSNVHRFHLRNGIKLLVREDPTVPTVAIRAIFPGGLRGESLGTNGAFAFISNLLPKGTSKLSSREMALKVSEMAGDLGGFNGKNTFGLKADFLARFFDPGLNLLSQVLLDPAFSPEEAEKIRPEMLSQLKQQEDSLTSLAFKEFNRILFQGHPYGLNTAGSEEAIKKFTADDLKQIYFKHARPDRLVLAISGAVKAEEVFAAVEKAFGNWHAPAEKNNGLEEEILPPYPPSVPQILNIPRDKEQIHVIIGFLGTTMYDNDRSALEILDTVLSGQSGRLFMELRDKKSLAYSLSSFSLLGLDTGSFGIYIGTSPDKKDEAIQDLWKELYRIKSELISQEELQRAKNILISQYELGLQTHGSQAMEMALNGSYDLGQDFGNKYITALETVTPEKVREIAQKYIQPDKYVLVSVGARFNPEPPAAGSQTGSGTESAGTQEVSTSTSEAATPSEEITSKMSTDKPVDMPITAESVIASQPIITPAAPAASPAVTPAPEAGEIKAQPTSPANPAPVMKGSQPPAEISMPAKPVVPAPSPVVSPVPPQQAPQPAQNNQATQEQN